jgi:hypothetical protein
VDHYRRSGGRDDLPQRLLRLGRRHGGQHVVAGGGRHPAREHHWQRRLVELHHHRRVRQSPAYLLGVSRGGLGERGGQVAARARVPQRPAAAGHLHGRREGEGPGQLELQRAGVALRGFLQCIQVPTQERRSAPFVEAGAVDQPPTRRLQVHVQVDEQSGSPADQVGARAAGGQLRQVGQVRQFPEHDPGGLGDVGAGQRADAGRRARGPGVRRGVWLGGHLASLRPCRPGCAWPEGR